MSFQLDQLTAIDTIKVQLKVKQALANMLYGFYILGAVSTQETENLLTGLMGNQMQVMRTSQNK